MSSVISVSDQTRISRCCILSPGNDNVIDYSIASNGEKCAESTRARHIEPWYPAGTSECYPTTLPFEKNSEKSAHGNNGLVLFRRGILCCHLVRDRTFLEKSEIPRFSVLRERQNSSQKFAFFLQCTEKVILKSGIAFPVKVRREVNFLHQQAHADIFRDNCTIGIHDRCPSLWETVLLRQVRIMFREPMPMLRNEIHRSKFPE